MDFIGFSVMAVARHAAGRAAIPHSCPSPLAASFA
jgi:hypothetical protein